MEKYKEEQYFNLGKAEEIEFENAEARLDELCNVKVGDLVSDVGERNIVKGKRKIYVVVKVPEQPLMGYFFVADLECKDVLSIYPMHTIDIIKGDFELSEYYYNTEKVHDRKESIMRFLKSAASQITNYEGGDSID